MSFVYDYGGQIAVTRKGKWIGTLDSPQAIAGLDRMQERSSRSALARARRRTRRTRSRTRSSPRATRRRCRAPRGSPAASATYAKVSEQFVMPSHTPGKSMPGFLGGSGLAVPVGANKALGPTGSGPSPTRRPMKVPRQRGSSRTRRNLLGNSITERAAANSWFVPTGEELDQHRERQRPPQHADADPYREAHRQAGGDLREQQHHVDPQRVAVTNRDAGLVVG